MAFVVFLPALLAQPTLGPEVLVSPPKTSFNLQAVGISATDSAVWLTVENLEKTPFVHELWKVDAGGNRARSIPIGIEGTPPIDRYESPMQVTDEGDVYLLGWIGNKLHLIKVQSSGRTEFIRPVSIPFIHPLGLLRAPHNTWILFGDGDGGAAAAKVDEKGKLIWRQSVRKTPLAAIFIGGACRELRQDYRQADHFGR